MAASLQTIANGAMGVPIGSIGMESQLVREVQKRLEEVGLLDPPVDGLFGAGSRWALETFLRKAGLQAKVIVDAAVARALLDADPAALFPVSPKPDLAGRLVVAMGKNGHWIQRHPDCLNIIYVEGMDSDGKANGNTKNAFNDARILLRINKAGTPVIEGIWDATTEPGEFYVKNPLPEVAAVGTARIAFGQYKAWNVNIHGGSDPHEALCQVRNISIFRDLDKDFQRTGDKQYEGLFAINQHRAYGESKNDIGKASAGCLVGHLKGGHLEFMKALKSDPRYVANKGYIFMSAIMPVGDLP